jgi:hypothetical protein
VVQVVLSHHAIIRFLERGVDPHEIKKIAKTGKIVNINDRGIIKKRGILCNERPVIVVCKEVSNKIIVITVYYEDNLG